MQIAARTAAWEKSGGWVNPYVTDGLIAMWDGEWNAGGGVHDPNATEWKDLSGNMNDIALPSSFRWEEMSVRTPDVAYATPFTTGSVFSSNKGTLEAVFEHTKNDSTWNYSRIVALDWSSNRDYRLAILIGCANNDLAVQCGNIRSSKYDQTNIAHIGLNEIKSVSFYRQSTTDMGCFLNGNKIELGGFSGVDVPESGLLIGGDSPGIEADNFLGRLFSIRVYNTRLRDSDIAANYAVDKARFNLP